MRELEGDRWRVLTRREAWFWQQGLLMAGVDEVGRGPLAGPVVAGAVILRHGTYYEGLDDSKKLTPKRREDLYRRLVADGNWIGVGAVGPRTIERINIYQASRLAMIQAVNNLEVRPDWILSDAMPLEGPVPVDALIGGDGRSASIAAASVVAKVLRDRYMDALDHQFPGYGFARHKGYATSQHLEALALLGPCSAHRRTFLTKKERRPESGPPLASERDRPCSRVTIPSV